MRDMTKIVAEARAVAEEELLHHDEACDRFGGSDQETENTTLNVPAWVLRALLDKIKAEEKLADLLADEAEVDIERRDNVLVFQRRADKSKRTP